MDRTNVRRPPLIVATLVIVAATVTACAPGKAGRDEMTPSAVEAKKSMTLTDRPLMLRYQSGLDVLGKYGSNTVVWEALSGPARGSSGTESTQVAAIAPGIFFVSWIEQNGTTVSQVLDLNLLQVTAFVTYTAGSGRQSHFDVGTIEIKDP